MLKLLFSLFAILTVAVSLPSFAGSTRVGDMVIEQPWARASIGISRPSAAFLTIKNTGRTSDVLTDIRTPVAGLAELHKTEIKDGVAGMGPAGRVEIPAEGAVILAPGGHHIMLMMLQQPLKKGDHFPMTLLFEEAGPIDVIVRVQGVGAAGPDQ
ncbi:MAG: copper chaperone PCu(A)C [Parvularculales bacterium]